MVASIGRSLKSTKEEPKLRKWEKEMTNTQKQIKVSKIVNEISKREIRNYGRWTEITMKRSGRKFIIVRTGYGPMERPEWDGHEVKEKSEVVAEFKNLYELAVWLMEIE